MTLLYFEETQIRGRANPSTERRRNRERQRSNSLRVRTSCTSSNLRSSTHFESAASWHGDCPAIRSPRVHGSIATFSSPVFSPASFRDRRNSNGGRKISTRFSNHRDTGVLRFNDPLNNFEGYNFLFLYFAMVLLRR